MSDQIQQKDINSAAWAACDTFRGVMMRRDTKTISS